MNKNLKARRAFSLLEMLIVVCILTIVGLVFIPLAKYKAHDIRIKAIHSQLDKIGKDGRKYLNANLMRRMSYDRLVEEKAIPPANSVLGENYHELVLTMTGGTLTVETSKGEKISVTY